MQLRAYLYLVISCLECVRSPQQKAVNLLEYINSEAIIASPNAILVCILLFISFDSAINIGLVAPMHII